MMRRNLFENLKAGTLIGKYLTGKESVEESIQLKDWIEQDVANMKLFDSIKNEKELSNSNEEFDQFDSEAAWEKYNESISKQTKRKIYFRWRVADSVLLIVALSSVDVLYYYSNNEGIITEVAEQIQPGQPKAFIEMGNGTRFDLQNLDKKQQDKLASDVGIVVEGNTLINSKEIQIEKQPEIITLVTPRGGEYKMILNDETEVWLNADSRLEFPDKFPEDRRKVKLKGKAYFSVSKDNERPFIVNLNRMDVEVLGTEFNISAYSNDDEIKTTLIEGKVAIRNSIKIGVEQKTLAPGEQASFHKEESTLQIKKVDVNEFIAWKDGRFVFVCQTLGEIAEILERWYDVDFVFIDENLKAIPFTGEFLRYDYIEKVYEIIKKTGTE